MPLLLGFSGQAHAFQTTAAARGGSWQAHLAVRLLAHRIGRVARALQSRHDSNPRVKCEGSVACSSLPSIRRRGPATMQGTAGGGAACQADPRPAAAAALYDVIAAGWAAHRSAHAQRLLHPAPGGVPGAGHAVGKRVPPAAARAGALIERGARAACPVVVRLLGGALGGVIPLLEGGLCGWGVGGWVGWGGGGPES
jgi:hypothetical protein